MAQRFKSCLTDEMKRRLWEIFPSDKAVTNRGQREVAKLIADATAADASARKLLANQVVEFLVVHRSVKVRCVVQELKNLYGHEFGRSLCRWQNRRDEQPLQRSQLTSVG